MDNKIRITRDSVSAGDSMFAPNEAFLDYIPEQSLSSWLTKVIDYLPKQKDVIWKVRCNGKTVAFITYPDSEPLTPLVNLACSSSFMSELTPAEFSCVHFCRYQFKGTYPDHMSITEIKDKLLMEALQENDPLGAYNHNEIDDFCTEADRKHFNDKH